MSWNPARPPRRGAALVLPLAVLAAVVAVAAALAPALHRPAGRPGPAGRPVPRRTSAVVPPAPAGPPAVDGGPLALPAPRGSSHGVGTGYPPGPAGAVSAAVHDTALLDRLDPVTAADQAAVLADPSWVTARQDAAYAAERTRRYASSYQVVPRAYQFEAGAGTDTPTVLLLVSVTPGTATAPSRTITSVLTVNLHWTGADWRLLDPAAPGPPALAAVPGSQEAVAKGWLTLDD